MNKTLKKLFVCSASLLMMASLGAGINNASARRVRHYRPRTHRVAMNNHALYKQGKKDNYAYIGTCEANDYDSPKAKRLANKLINRLIAYHFNRSYVKGLCPKMPANAGMSITWNVNEADNLLARAKKVARQRTHKPINVKRQAIKKHVRKNVKRNKHARKAKKTTAKKHNVRKHTKARKSNANSNNKQSSTATISEAELDKMPDSELDNLPDSVVNKMPESEYDKYMNRLEDSTPDNPDNIQDMTDGGKYYNWDQLEDILYGTNSDGESLIGGYASDALKDKIKDSISYGLHNELYSPNQLKELYNDNTLYQLDPNLTALAGAHYAVDETSKF